jgi:tetratricopeptide (TPR) repeat protein
MYLRTPKRYQARHRRRSLRLFSARKLFILVAIAGIAYGGWLVWLNQDTVRDTVLPELEGIVESAQTQVAPLPTPTATPDLMVARSGCLTAYQQGHMEEAIEQCSLLAEGNPNDIDLYYRVTQMLVFNSNLGANEIRIDEALVFAEKTINANPEAPHGWTVRALALDWKGIPERALAPALHAKSLDDTFAPAYAVLGEIYHDLGKNDLAEGYLDQALELDTAGIAVGYIFRTRGKISSDQGLYQDALQPYQAALQNAANDSYIVLEMANNYIALGQGDKAIDLLVGALERNPHDTGVLFQLARAHLNVGAYERAEEYYLRCLDVDPDNVACLSYLGGLQKFSGDYGSAISNLGRAIQLGSDDPDDFLQIGEAYTALGQCERAVPYLQQGYQITIDQEDVRRQANFVSTLQDCGVVINQPVPSADTSQ